MYKQYFGLREKPFSITPDPRYLYLSQRHADALAHLIYGISHSGGFIQLTGEVGTGKTTLVRTLFEQLPDEADVALILNPELSVPEFLAAILEELKIPPPADNSNKMLIGELNRRLLDAHARGRRTVLIVDEAQNLSPNILEQVRLLTNLETPKQKLLQIILIGQPELRDLLAREDMRQLAQRVTGRYHLEPLNLADTGKYLEHRLKVAGAGGGIFTPSAVREIFRQSDGIPRIINVIADRTLLAAYTQDTRSIDARLVRRAAVEVFGKPRMVGWRAHLAAALTVTGIGAIGLATVLYTIPEVPPAQPVIEQAAVAVVDRTAGPAPAIEAAFKPIQEPTPVIRRTMASLLEDPAVPKNTDSAFTDLFGLWGASYESGGTNACEQALQQQLRCWFQKGTLNHLMRLNRPAILSLIDARGDEFQIVLSRLDATTATLRAGGLDYPITLDDLANYWYGDHLILWRPVNADGSAIGPGSSGDDIIWLRDSLAIIYGEATSPRPSDVFDSALEERVRNFQRERRLTVDGIVGTQTQIVINTETAVPSTPVLAEPH